MKRFGLAGKPIDHSKSPALFKAAYGDRYPYDLIGGGDFNASFKTFLEAYHGINVTAPYKAEACAMADQLTNGCIVSGSANTLVKTPKGIKAWNTDIDGVRGCLKELFEQADEDRGEWTDGTCGEGKTALVIGCGGAGRAAALAALLEGFSLILMNRNREKAENYTRKLTILGKGPQDKISAAGPGEFDRCAARADVIIYTLPVKLPELDHLAARSNCPNLKAVIEANYRDPAFGGPLAQKLEHRGTAICTGERWLLHQAVAAYRIFTGEEPDIEAMAKVL